MQFHILLKEL